MRRRKHKVAQILGAGMLALVLAACSGPTPHSATPVTEPIVLVTASATATSSFTPTPTPTPTPKTPAQLLAEQQLVAGRGEWVDCAVNKCLALTFDDGPGDQTPQLVETLTKEHVPAVFFMQWLYANRNPGYVALIANTPGMETGNHTLSHPELTKISPALVGQEISGQHQFLLEHGAKEVPWMRPPYGLWNGATVHACAATGEALVTWSIDSLDYVKKDTAVTTANVVAGARQGGIVLMHDIHPSTVAAVPGIIAQLKEQGYLLVNLTQLLGAPQPGKTYEMRS
ncbi:MAG: polysaccharide deacetylase family protein [Propionibacteriaceae bacterium]